MKSQKYFATVIQTPGDMFQGLENGTPLALAGLEFYKSNWEEMCV
jgi:hypothetical protein